MNLRYLFLLTAVAGLVSAAQEIPRSYYKDMDGKSGAELKTAVHNIIYPHTEVSSYSALPQYFERTDVYPGSSRWWDMYSDIPLYAPSFKGLNREHSFPKSWWKDKSLPSSQQVEYTPAYVDLFHLYPSEAAANQAKSNYPLGQVDRTNIKFQNGVSTVGSPVSGQGGGSTWVFEPDDEYKGDFARTYFYIVTCYQNLHWAVTYMLENNVYPTLNRWSREMLLDWARQDKVSQKERDRNESVYLIQANRNPFIDFPELAEYLWGRKQGEVFRLAEHISGYNPDAAPALVTPIQGMELEFNQVALGMTSTAKLHLKGENLQANRNLRLAIYDNSETHDAALFTMGGQSVQQVSGAAVNGADGIWVNVTYRPTSVGLHSTRMVISGAGIEGSIGIGLSGECLPYPELGAPIVKEPSDVTSTSYVANWEPAPGDVVDYYVVNRTCYTSSGTTTEQIEAETNSLLIDDFTGSESYTVQSVRLGIKSPESQSMQVTPSSITGVAADASFGVKPCEGGVRVVCTGRLDAVRVADMTGTIVSEIYGVASGDVIELPSGIYIISADGIRRPVKIVVEE